MLGMLKQLAIVPLEVFGVIGHYEAYPHSTVKQYEAWTVRRYAPAVAAQVQSRFGDEYKFAALAAYIGVFGTPKNQRRSRAQSVEKSAPKGASTPISMTVPVVNTDNNRTMQFILPSKYKHALDAPLPTDPAVEIVDLSLIHISEPTRPRLI
eukprot:5835289-Amphidinium_carterae.2